MTDSVQQPTLSPEERLRLSRLALVEALQPKTSHRQMAVADTTLNTTKTENPVSTDVQADKNNLPIANVAQAQNSSQTTTNSTSSENLGVVLLQAARNLVDVWWERHPANVAIQVGAPLLERTVRRKPMQALAVSAAVGAAIFVLKPWRWKATKSWTHKRISSEMTRLGPAQLGRMVFATLIRRDL